VRLRTDVTFLRGLDMSTDSGPVWIDLDNTPHVPFFSPIIDALRRRGMDVVVSARDAYNVTELLDLYRIESALIGRHNGGNKLMKVLGLGVRCTQLLPFVLRHRPRLAVSHGSRAQLLVAKLTRVPSVVIADYEHVTHVARPDVLIVPQLMPSELVARLSNRVCTYPGIKEDVYASSFTPDPSILTELGLSEDDLVVTVRPPATEAHYHNPQSETLFAAAMNFLAEDRRTRLVMLPRNERQKVDMQRTYSGLLDSAKMVLPTKAVEGLNLVWHSDLVVSGGGTMNREAAALGVPVYSTFRGQIGAVDRYLASHGRLVLLEDASDVRRRVVLTKRRRDAASRQAGCGALDAIVEELVAVAA
jgi:uncharacterized protein